jgi:hypothetical protein
LWAAGSGGRCIRRWGSSVLRRPAAEVRRGSDGRWSGCRQRVSGRRGARMRAEMSGVSCVGLWVLHPSGCGDVGEACGMSGFGCQRAVHRVVGSGGQACGVSGFWGQRPCVGLQVALVSRQCVGRWGSGVQYLGHGVGVAGVRPQTPEEAQPWITLEQHCVESWWSWCRRSRRAPT